MEGDDGLASVAETLAGLTAAARAVGRTTPAGNARTRDAAAVSLLRAIQRQQEHERRTAAR